MWNNARAAARLPAQDLDRARAFYRDKLGLEPADHASSFSKSVRELAPNEFRGIEFDHTLARLGARHSRIHAGRPQTNGNVEALHKTILDECWRPVFARYIHPRYAGLRRELDTMSRTCRHHPESVHAKAPITRAASSARAIRSVHY
jgi:transposase InsO family protein